MTPDRLRELIASGETLDAEWKGEETERVSDSELVDAVVCLANRPGDDPDWILVTVEDDRRATDAHPRQEGNTVRASAHKYGRAHNEYGRARKGRTSDRAEWRVLRVVAQLPWRRNIALVDHLAIPVEEIAGEAGAASP